MLTETFSTGFAVVLGIGCSASLVGLVLLRMWARVPAPVAERIQ
jgi:hypothetical protein